MFIGVSSGLNLVEVRWDVGYLIQVLRSDLADVQIYQVTVVCVDLSEFLLIELLGINESLNVHMLVRQDHGCVSVSVSRSLLVIDLEIFVLLVLVN